MTTRDSDITDGSDANADIDRLCGAWKGDETAEEIMQTIEGDRRSRIDPPPFLPMGTDDMAPRG